ncbi:hypothetical protein [Paenibacillus andongensis]|uniref:hypothetical protein n=1 Tax=Paenibacillus andongensis TaxID=2975482 RepID=UPI0021BA567E|nr:hypothetical protein [Paenibacillus andongensis]
MFISENQLDEWVRGNTREAQGKIVELVWRLIAASSPRPIERRFPLGDSIGQPGPDGVLNTVIGFDPFVPEGKSFWEIGTGIDAGSKATTDYRELTEVTPQAVRQESTFIFITPLSGRRDWQHTWKEESQARWLLDRRQRNEWSDVRVIDGSGIIDWLNHFPAVERWLAETMGIPFQDILTAEQHWAELMSIGDPPPLKPNVFLANREEAFIRLNEIFSGATIQLKIDSHYPDQVVDFVSAFLANMDTDTKADTIGRSLIISSAEAWNAITSILEPHVLIANFNFDENDSIGTKLLQRARKGGHAVIFPGMPGGVPHPNRVTLNNPKSYHIKEQLEKSGYNEERARLLAQKSDGNLSSLLRCLQNLSLMPEWAQGTDAAELAIAELLGGWTETSEADKKVIEKLSGNHYGDWIGKIRNIAHRPASPLIQRDGKWKVVMRYEGWYALGSRMYEEHLIRLKEAAVDVLSERDPQFDLPSDQRYTASIHGNVLTHSKLLRNGLAETLALLGSHPNALTSCSRGKAETIATLAVRELLDGADWVLWASLNHHLPLLAEAAPNEFLNLVEDAMNLKECPFDQLFAQEGSGLMGWNYLTGLLWALESLAWDSKYLTRVVVILGELAERDPGGTWANRPSNSLSTILLPWLPQTCASLPTRRVAIETLLKETPEVAWKLLLKLIPSKHQSSSGSHKPAWRELISDDWSGGVTHQEYREQITMYSELATRAAEQDLSKLSELVDRLNDLPVPARNHLLAYLQSEKVLSMSEADRVKLWTKLIDLVSKHKKFSEAEWAMKPGLVNEIASIAENIAPLKPFYLYQRLFSENELYEVRGNYEEQRKELEDRRQKAVREVFIFGGLESVLDFALSIETPWRVGYMLGYISVNEIETGAETEILPAMLESKNKHLAQFAGGFVWGSFRERGWQWIDGIDTSMWTSSQKGQFLAYLPFTLETWERATKLLGEDEPAYWAKANVNQYEAEEHLERAIDLLVKYGRPNAAIRCIERQLYEKMPLNASQAVRTLQAVVSSSEESHTMNVHAIIEVIKALQDSRETDPNDLFQIEWAFLPLLDRNNDASAKLLERKLAEHPEFFCEVIRTVFRSKFVKDTLKEELTEQQKDIATNAYRLLREWNTPPGNQIDGEFDGNALNLWFEHVKAACEESGHLEIALSMIGKVLIYSPPDPDGLWLHHSVAKMLNAKDVNDMRNGFTTELFNSRGAYWGSAGREERELAKKYFEMATEVDACGYQRLANALRLVAESYEREAEREELRDPFDE